jgi:Putative transmembrane protein (PGPGW)
LAVKLRQACDYWKTVTLAIMIGELKQHYEELKAGPPGKRFQELHRRRAARGKRRKSLVIAAAIALIAIGIAMLVLPGPGLIFLVGGVGLIAQELLVVARALDALELQLRSWLGQDKESLQSAPNRNERQR